MSSPQSKSKRPVLSDEQQQLAALCEVDLKTFIQEAWPIVVPQEPFQDSKHIDAITEHLEWLANGEFFNLLINMPPKFGKSVINSVMFPAWLWIRDPSLRIISASYGQQLSTRDALAHRILISSNWYRERWGDRYAIQYDQNEKTRFENSQRGIRIATSIGGMLTGETGDLIIVDDPHNVTEAASEVKRQEVLDWWNIAMPSRSGRKGRAKRLVVMQRVHELDLSGEILKQGNFTHLCLPMEFETKLAKTSWRGWRDWRTEEGELLWPTRFTPEIIQATLKPPIMTSNAYAGQYQQRPAPAEGGMFLRKWWKYHNRPAEALLAKPDDSVWSFDMAFKDHKDSDFVCGLAIVREKADFYILPHRIHERMGFSASKQAVKNCNRMYPMRRILIEDKANGTAIVEELKRDVGRVLAIEPEGGKESRAASIQGWVEGGNVYLPEDAAWVEEFIQELAVFPNGANDDYVDALSQALVNLLEKMGKSFDPIVWSINRTTSSKEVGERMRDPRYSDEVIVVPNPKESANRLFPAKPTAPPPAHAIQDPDHRAECRQCRAYWRAS